MASIVGEVGDTFRQRSLRASASPSAPCCATTTDGTFPDEPVQFPGALPRHSRPAARRKRTGEMRGLLPLRRRLSGATASTSRPRKIPTTQRISAGERYAKCLQHRLLALHLLRILRRSLPHRRHHPRPRLRTRHLRHQFPDLPKRTTPRKRHPQRLPQNPRTPRSLNPNIDNPNSSTPPSDARLPRNSPTPTNFSPHLEQKTAISSLNLNLQTKKSAARLRNLRQMESAGELT